MDAFASLIDAVNEKITTTIGAAQHLWNVTRDAIALGRDAARVIPLRTFISLQLNVIKGKPYAFERLFDAMVFYEELEEQEAELREEEEAEEQQEEFDEFVRVLAGLVEEAEEKILKARQRDQEIEERCKMYEAGYIITPHAPTGVHGHACPTEDAPALPTFQVADDSRAKRSLMDSFNAAAASPPSSPESTSGKRDREEDTEEEERPTRRQRTSEQFVVRQDIFENDDE